ncbi:hypothetical protein [Sphingomonas sp. Leaf28]|uniref:hypothetical protein n=1 Tax=Sphingomonas sp. Leaf28 TaxID=1735695 RepID=UPI000B14CFAA|nr:hypothetical protein [Sphingomonas sp. Leaf28]
MDDEGPMHSSRNRAAGENATDSYCWDEGLARRIIIETLCQGGRLSRSAGLAHDVAMPDDTHLQNPSIPDAELRDLMKQSLFVLDSKKDSAVGWLGAAFAAFNAAALATALTFAEKMDHPVVVCALFLTSLLLIFATGVAYAYALSEITDAVSENTQIFNVSRPNIDDENYAEKLGMLDKLGENLHPTIIIALLAGVFTLAGVVTFSSGIEMTNPANDRRCLAIQHDMLSASPRRSDSADLFQALGCRPQGEGSVFAKPRTPALLHQDRTREDRTPVAAPAAPDAGEGVSGYQGPGRAG